jgi:hypothetical protein
MATIWTTIEYICVIAFSCDLTIRGVGAAAAGKGAEFLDDAMNYIDLLAIFPSALIICALSYNPPYKPPYK